MIYEVHDIHLGVGGGSVVVNAEVRDRTVWSASAAKAVFCALESAAGSSASLADVIDAIPAIKSVKANPCAPLTASQTFRSVPNPTENPEW